MSTPNPLEQAAIPSAVAILTAVQTFITNLGTDPAKIPLTAPGALQVLLGTVELQGPALAVSEWSAVQSAANSKLSSWITSLKAKQS